MARIILVRHGETEWNKVHRLQGGGSDVPLNDLGRRQAERLAEHLRGEKLAAVYASPLERATYTAQAIAREHNLPVIPLAGLREIELGNLEGFPSRELIRRFDEHIAANSHLDENDGAESVEQVQARAWQAVLTIASAHRESTVAAVAHYFVIATLVCKVLDLPLERLGRLRMSPGSLTAFSLDADGAARLEMFNAPA